MTTRPRLVIDSRQVVGVIAVALFGILAAVFLTAPFSDHVGFSGDGSITASIGYALLNLAGGGFESEGFLVALIIVALVLDAAIDGAVMLAKREDGPTTEGARELLGDGGQPSSSQGEMDSGVDNPTAATDDTECPGSQPDKSGTGGTN